MPKLASYKRIVTNDFEKEDRKFVEKIAGPINDAFNELYFATNGRLSLTENLYCSVKILDVTVDSNGIPVNQTVFTVDKPTPVIGIQVIQAVNQENSGIYPTGQPFVSFSPITTGILINHVSGLQANQRYTLRLIAWH